MYLLKEFYLKHGVFGIRLLKREETETEEWKWQTIKRTTKKPNYTVTHFAQTFSL